MAGVLQARQMRHNSRSEACIYNKRMLQLS
jgi:hypothetical protein